MTASGRRLFREPLRAAMALAALMAAFVFVVLPAAAAERVALVIGNSAYSAATSLKNPRNDAEAMTAALKRLDFKVITGTDVDLAGLRAAVRAFTRDIEQARVALFFYAGHGLQVNGRNFLIPVDASLQRESDIDFEAMDLNFVLRQLERKDRTNIVFLDACRNNPLAAKLASTMGQRSVFVGRGLARIETGVGTFIGFATQPDNVALDGEGANSPFTEALLKHLETPGLDIELLMRRVREDVILLTSGRQVPWSNSSLVGDRVVLKAGFEAAPEPAPAQSPVRPDADGTNTLDMELALWSAVKDTGNVAFLRSYLDTYPNGSFAALARAMIEEIEGRRRANVAPAEEAPAVEEKPAAPAVEAAPVVEEAPKVEPVPVVNLAPEAPAEAPAAVEKKPQPAVLEKKPEPAPAAKKKPVVKLEAPEAPAPRVKKAPAVEKKKKIEKPRVAAPPVEKKPRVKRVDQSVPVLAQPVANCGLCWPNGIKSFGRRRFCGVAFQSALADGFCTP